MATGEHAGQPIAGGEGDPSESGSLEEENDFLKGALQEQMATIEQLEADLTSEAEKVDLLHGKIDKAAELI